MGLGLRCLRYLLVKAPELASCPFQTYSPCSHRCLLAPPPRQTTSLKSLPQGLLLGETQPKCQRPMSASSLVTRRQRPHPWRSMGCWARRLRKGWLFPWAYSFPQGQGGFLRWQAPTRTRDLARLTRGVGQRQTLPPATPSIQPRR